MLPRLTRHVFVDLAIWMVGFALAAGVITPFFVVALGVDAEQVLTLPFFIATHVVGLIVGIMNVALAAMVFQPRLSLLHRRMHSVEKDLREAMYSGDLTSPELDKLHIEVDTNDEIGNSAEAFNDMVTTLARAREVEAALGNFSQVLSENLEFTPLTKNALDLLLQYTGSAAGAILVQENGELRAAANHGLVGVDALGTSMQVRRALGGSKSQHLVIPGDLMVEGVVINFRPREVIVVPVEYNQAAFGCVALATADQFAPDVLRLLDLFRQGLALALHNSLAHEKLQQIAAMDPLTGLYNRRFGLTRLHEEFTRASRTGGEIGVLIFDLDHFKKVNDTYGHLVGDRVLIRVASTAKRVFREGDILVRYGGEEFYAILPGAAVSDTREIAERLRHMVEETEVHDGEQTIGVTVSVGVTGFPEYNADKEEELIKRADEALYTAKKNGRNQVVVAA